ncbi:gamma-glutamyltransferase [Halomarina litorea]|uniref:gamma-glutamyltransferase n=1 Tax=Halomarina litorea TaxID=2961595 RepID=UPI0020C4A2B9|nr:gamma-glutamyltransferase [Halomarina sp. BCD28]
MSRKDGGRSRDAGDHADLSTNRRSFLAGTAALGVGMVTGGAGVVAGDDGDGTTQDGEMPAPSVARAADGMVASVHPQASEVGKRVLAGGGNAVDAAVAVQFALNVTQPHTSGIGGGGFMLVYDADEDETYAVDNRERAPLNAEKDMFLQENGEPIPFGERIGLGQAVGVPGTLRACDVALKRFGSRDIADLIEPAIQLAKPNGTRVEVDAFVAQSIRENMGRFNDAARDLFVPDGEPLSEGDTLDQPHLAEAFRRIRDEGIGALYGGELGQALADVVQEEGGSMTVDDLARYNVTIDHAEHAEYDGLTVRTMSLPSSGGLTIGHILNLVDPLDLGQYDPRDAAKYHALVEAFGLAYADRGEYMGDKAFVDAPWQGLFDEAYLAERRGLIPPHNASPGRPQPGDPWSYQPGNPYVVEAPSVDVGSEPGGSRASSRNTSHTTHFTVADGDGNLVSWTSTIEQLFGSGIVVPEYGVVLNNELTDFDAVPGGPNEVAPTKRPLSSTSPTIVFEDGDPLMTVGSPGGKTIITTVAQVIVNVATFGLSLPEAVREPRIYNDTDPEVLWEPAVPDGTVSNLRERNHTLQPEPRQLGNVQAIRVTDDGYLDVADGRRAGLATGTGGDEEDDD